MILEETCFEKRVPWGHCRMEVLARLGSDVAAIEAFPLEFIYTKGELRTPRTHLEFRGGLAPLAYWLILARHKQYGPMLNSRKVWTLWHTGSALAIHKLDSIPLWPFPPARKEHFSTYIYNSRNPICSIRIGYHKNKEY